MLVSRGLARVGVLPRATATTAHANVALAARSAPLALQIRHKSIAHEKATAVPSDDSMKFLVEQRLRRPVAPHLSIYKPQLTWYMSGLERITGVMFSGGLYLFGLAYAAGPLLGYKITAAGMAAGFAKWPVVAKVAAKAVVALPFTFHSYNGVRHIVFDTGVGYGKMTVIRTAQIVIGLAGVSAIGLACI